MRIDPMAGFARSYRGAKTTVLAGVLIVAEILACAPTAFADPASGTLKFNSARVVYDHNPAENWEYVAVYTQFVLTGFKGRNCELVVQAVDANQAPLKYPDGALIQVVILLTPGFETTFYVDDSFAAAFKVEELRVALGPQDRGYSFRANVRDVETNTWLMSGNYKIDFVNPVAK